MYYYQIEWGQKDLINSSAFYSLENALDEYESTGNHCKSNQDSIVCIDQESNYIDRFDLTEKVWETDHR